MANATKDKIFVLAKREGVKATNGLVDNRLFTGGNSLKAVQEDNGLWSLRYEYGILPEQLKQRFTSFATVLKTVKLYFDARNIDVKEIIE